MKNDRLKTSMMASSQKCRAFPLLSLPANNKLLVISFKNNKTHEEKIKLMVVQYKDDNKITDFIEIPLTESITFTVCRTLSLTHFHDVFDRMTNKKYLDSSLKKKLTQAFNDFSHTFTKEKNLIRYLDRLSEKASINLLNVKAFEKEFTKVSISEMTLQEMREDFSVHSLYGASDSLHRAITETNLAIFNFLAKVNKKEASELHWALNKLTMLYDLEQTTRTYALRIFKEAVNISDQYSEIKPITLQLLDDLSEVQEDNHQRHFINYCFLPEFDLPQEILSHELQDRVTLMETYDAQLDHLAEFDQELIRMFESQLFPSC